MNVLVDDEDRWLLELYSWRALKTGKSSTHYLCADTTIDSKRVNLRLHHFIAGKPLPGYHTDHINRNGLDNRRCNLRTVTVRESMLNRRGWSATGFRCIRKNGKGWVGQVTINRNRYITKTFRTPEEAANAAIELRKHLANPDDEENDK